VVFHGHVSNAALGDLYARARVAVAPLLTGAGVKGKVNQAMAHGVPVVATPVAVEGMHAVNGSNCLVAESAEGLAAAIVSAAYDRGLWEQLREGGLRLAYRFYSPAAAQEALLQALGALGLHAPTSKTP
jgi:glycosyltransferase involved in cell wall biosynthesis